MLFVVALATVVVCCRSCDCYLVVVCTAVVSLSLPRLLFRLSFLFVTVDVAVATVGVVTCATIVRSAVMRLSLFVAERDYSLAAIMMIDLLFW